ncbi:crustacean hyperglycemic hormone B-like [Macrobrachium nipponense]|uniref:crustacean hyperglycemic hormone B-like n=1 Tax=Macrobrachium nipponense TaxID=159736 RepID=UPI0030C83475
MFSKNLIRTTIFMGALLLLGNIGLVAPRSADGLARIEKLLSLSSSSSSYPSSLASSGLAATDDLAVNKRAILDPTCKGIFDRGLLKKLEKVCEDCYNVYRKPYVAVECRSNCFGNLIFRQCLDDLLMMDVVDEYVNMVQVVG